MALAFRGVWVLSSSFATSDSTDVRVLYGKRFPCCETLCTVLQSQPLPESDSEIASLFAARRPQLLLSSGAFPLLQHSSCSSSPATPSLPQSALVSQPSHFRSPPVCFICAHSVFIVGVPVCSDVLCVRDGTVDDDSARPLLTAAIWFLHTFSESISRVDWTGTGNSGELHVADFVSKLCAALPMGRPSAFCEGTSAAACITGKGFTPQTSFSWRPVAPARSKKRLDLRIREIVCGHIYSRADKADVIACDGTITCLADIDGSPDITLTITNARALTQVRAHACAQRPEISNGDFTLSFSPPIDRFALARYTVDCSMLPDGGLPFHAEYEALALPDGSASLSLTIRSTPSCAAVPVGQLRALLPLQGWAGKAISSAKFSRHPPSGSFVDVHEGAQAVVLALPIPSSAPYQVSIRVDFGGDTQTVPAVDMPFIHHTATCAFIQFSSTGLMSGVMCDSKCFMCHPSMSLDCSLEMSSASGRNSLGISQFCVWNKYGPSPD